jgi:hypothetical protein
MGLGALIALLGSEFVFEEAAHMLEKLTLVHVSPNTCRKETEMLGQLVAADEQTTLAAAWAADAPQLPAVTEPIVGDCYVSMDGVMVHIDGQGWKNQWLGAIYTAKAAPSSKRPETLEVRTQQPSFYADFGDLQTFGRPTPSTTSHLRPQGGLADNSCLHPRGADQRLINALTAILGAGQLTKTRLSQRALLHNGKCARETRNTMHPAQRQHNEPSQQPTGQPPVQASSAPPIYRLAAVIPSHPPASVRLVDCSQFTLSPCSGQTIHQSIQLAVNSAPAPLTAAVLRAHSSDFVELHVFNNTATSLQLALLEDTSRPQPLPGHSPLKPGETAVYRWQTAQPGVYPLFDLAGLGTSGQRELLAVLVVAP